MCYVAFSRHTQRVKQKNNTDPKTSKQLLDNIKKLKVQKCAIKLYALLSLVYFYFSCQDEKENGEERQTTGEKGITGKQKKDGH